MAFEILATLATQVIATLGYPGVFVLMALESTAAPVPSEAVLPFAGFLVAQGKFEFWSVVLVASIGSIVGSLISYWIGAVGGRPLVNGVGKWLLLREGHLKHTESFFKRHGGKTIFIARFIPIVRHLISIPAGIARMDLKSFVLLTAVGATMWNAFLTFVGMKLMENWETILRYTQLIDYVILASLLLGGTWWILKLRRRA